MSHSDDLGWLPPDGVQLTRGDLVRILVALRALIDGTDPIEANRSHIVEIAHTIGEAMDRGEP